ncbi:MAG TPA: hypothetical protein DEF78_02905, partial [Sphingobacterium sp.]|nr:hypothetical protein [Sphingobacterium sp.]
MQYDHTKSMITSRHLLLLFLILGGLAGTFIFTFAGVSMAMAFYMLPIFLLVIMVLLSSPISCFFLLYIVSYLVMGFGRYFTFPLPVGVILDLLILFNFLSLALHFIRGNLLGKVYFNTFLLISILWMLY